MVLHAPCFAQRTQRCDTVAQSPHVCPDTTGLNSAGRYNSWIYFLPLLLPFWKGINPTLFMTAMMQICENQSENHIIYGRLLHKLTDWVPGEHAQEGKRV